MKYKHLQIIISIIALIILGVNIYYKGHFLTNISMILLSIGMGVQAYSLHKNGKKSGQVHFKTNGLNFLLSTIFLGCSGFFAVKKLWVLLVISILLSIVFGFQWFKTNRQKDRKYLEK